MRTDRRGIGPALPSRSSGLSWRIPPGLTAPPLRHTSLASLMGQGCWERGRVLKWQRTRRRKLLESLVRGERSSPGEGRGTAGLQGAVSGHWAQLCGCLPHLPGERTSVRPITPAAATGRQDPGEQRATPPHAVSKAPPAQPSPPPTPLSPLEEHPQGASTYPAQTTACKAWLCLPKTRGKGLPSPGLRFLTCKGGITPAPLERGNEERGYWR